MMLEIVSIVLDGMPFVKRHLPIFDKLSCRWFWRVAEGAASNTHCTSWCREQTPRLSEDGTSQYLDSISKHERVKIYRNKLWDGKVSMFNAMLTDIQDPSILLVVDIDEIWTADQLEKIASLFDDLPSLASIKFPCRYFVGPNLVLEGEDCYGDYAYEWIRAWHFFPGDTFVSHEPPILKGGDNLPVLLMDKPHCRKLGLVFDHFPYVTEAQVKFKQDFYGYAGLLGQWRALQAHKDFPVPLSRFFSHVSGELPLVVKLT